MIHVSRSGQAFGPYSIEMARAYLHTGHIQGDDLVWNEDKNVWMPAHDHPLLKDSQPPPPPLKSSQPTPIDKSALLETLRTCSNHRQSVGYSCICGEHVVAILSDV